DDHELQSVKLPLPACGFGPGYSYQVTGQAAPTAIAPVPCASDSGTTRFTFVADTQEGPEFVRQFAEEMQRFPAVAVLNGGDLVQTGDEFGEWVRFFDAMSPVGGSRMLVPAVGNHEYRGDKLVPLWERFFKVKASENHYAVELGHARVLVINSCFDDDH